MFALLALGYPRRPSSKDKHPPPHKPHGKDKKHDNGKAGQHDNGKAGQHEKHEKHAETASDWYRAEGSFTGASRAEAALDEKLEKLLKVDGSMSLLTPAAAKEVVRQHHSEYIARVSGSKENSRRRSWHDYDTFVAHFEPWREPHRRALHVAVEAVLSALPASWAWLGDATVPWRFIHASNALEGGMPHTIHHSIVLPEKWGVMAYQPKHNGETEKLRSVPRHRAEKGALSSSPPPPRSAVVLRGVSRAEPRPGPPSRASASLCQPVAKATRWAWQHVQGLQDGASGWIATCGWPLRTLRAPQPGLGA